MQPEVRRIAVRLAMGYVGALLGLAVAAVAELCAYRGIGLDGVRILFLHATACTGLGVAVGLMQRSVRPVLLGLAAIPFFIVSVLSLVVLVGLMIVVAVQLANLR